MPQAGTRTGKWGTEDTLYLLRAKELLIFRRPQDLLISASLCLLLLIGLLGCTWAPRPPASVVWFDHWPAHHYWLWNLYIPHVLRAILCLFQSRLEIGSSWVWGLPLGQSPFVRTGSKVSVVPGESPTSCRYDETVSLRRVSPRKDPKHICYIL